MRRNKTSSPSGDKEATDVLFIDASEMGYLKDRVHRDLSDNTLEEKKGNFDENGLGDYYSNFEHEKTN